MFQEAAADLTDVGLLLVELLLQPFQELPLEAVDLLDVAEDGPELLFREHVRPFAALLDVTLRKEKKETKKNNVKSSCAYFASRCIG